MSRMLMSEYPKIPVWQVHVGLFITGQSHDFWRAYSLFVARVASFAPEREAQGRK